MKFDEVLFHSRIAHENGHTICGLAWNPKGNKEIAYTDNQVNGVISCRCFKMFWSRCQTGQKYVTVKSSLRAKM